MNNTWIFKNGTVKTVVTSFPFAYRLMFYALSTGVKAGRNHQDMAKQMSIISPLKDAHGDFRTYTYSTATEMARNSNLLLPDGSINSKAFPEKKKNFYREQR